MQVSALLLPLALVLLSASEGEPARILVLLPFPGRSHFNSFRDLLDELANRGHELTVVSAFPRKTPLANYKDLAVEDYLGRTDVNFFQNVGSHPAIFMTFMSGLFTSNCERFLSYPQIQKFIRSKQEYDLILFEIFLSECAYGFVHKFQAPFIQISSNTITNWMGEGVGNPNIFSYVPTLMLSFSDHMSFAERLHNTLLNIYSYMWRNWYIVPQMEKIMRKYFHDPNIPSVHEIETNASFLLLNSHVSLNYPRPFTPNTAEVGGMHLKEPKKLPQDLQKYLDEAPNGVIYFSLGSHIRSNQMPLEIRNHFVKAFSQMKQKVLWKWEDDTLPDQPKNVRIGKWLPQNEILAHPNVKVFITHGGLLSTQEATYHGKPLVAVPIMADQRANAIHAQTGGYAILLEIKNVTVQSLHWALYEVLNTPSYAANAKRISGVFRDQPEKPLQRAVFWVEYVLRHQGAPHMRSAALRLNFIQYHLLDVFAFLLLAASLALALTVLACKALCRRLRPHNRVSKAKKEK